MDGERVEDRQRAVVGGQQHADFGATEDQAIRALIGKLPGNLLIGVARGIGDHAAAQLLEDDAVDRGAVGGAGYHRLYPGGAQPVSVEVLLHRIGRGHQRGAGETRRPDLGGGRVGHMHQRQIDALHHRVGDLVHGVGRQHDQPRTARLQGFRLDVQQASQPFPVACGLRRRDGSEIQTADQQLRRMKPAQLLLRQGAEVLVIPLGGGCGHATENADGLHVR